MFDRILSLIVAVGLALLVWLYARSSEKEYDLAETRVHFLCSADFALRPSFLDEGAGRIRLRIRGPAANEAPKVYAFVNLTQGNYSTPGRYHEPIQIQLPKGFELVQQPLRGVSFQLTPPERTTPAP